MSLDKRSFQNPPAEYRGAPFWSWNDDLQNNELIRQIRLLPKAGLGGFFMHSRSGLLTEYLGEAWMERVRACIEEAKRLGLKAWLYDEDRWPSGFAGGKVPERSEEFRSRCLVCQKSSEQPPAESKLIVTHGEHSFYEVLQPKISWFNGWSYVDLMNPAAVRAFLDESYEPYAKRFGKEFGGTVPGMFTDEPCNCWAPGRWPMMAAWTGALPARFQKDWGYDLLANLRSLFFDEGEFHKVRYHFWRTALALFVENFSQQIGDWCAQHKLALTGHYMAEDSLRYQLQWITAAMPHYEFMRQPGIDHLCRNIEDVITAKQCSSVANQLGIDRRLSEMYGCSGQNMSFEDRKWIGDWHLVLGINFVCHHLCLYSMKGCRKRDFPPNLYYQQPWWPENRIVDDYLARMCYVLSQGRPLIDIFVLHPLESVWCLQRNPRPMCLSAGDLHAADEFHPYEDSIVRLGHNLLGIQRDFDYGDETILSRHAKVEDGKFKVGKMEYRAVVLPSLLTLRRSTLQLLLDFLAQGGEVLSVGELPRLVEGVGDPRLEDLAKQATPVENKAECLRVALDRVVPADLAMDVVAAVPGGSSGREGSPAERPETGATTSIWAHQREIDGRRFIFLTNLSRAQSASARLSWMAKGTFERWDAGTGAIEAVPTTQRGELIETEIELAPAGSVLLAATTSSPSSIQHPASSISSIASWPISPQWDIQRLDPNALTLDFCRYQISGMNDWSEEFPVLGVQEILTGQKYVGPVALQFRFQTQRFLNKNVQIAVVVEEAAKWDVRVNGRPARYEGLPFYRDISFHPIDISLLVRDGENVIELRRHFEFADPSNYKDQAKRYGTELESTYLIGDFCVRGTPGEQPIPVNPHHKRWGLPEIPVLRYQPRWTLSDDKQVVNTGDLVAQGYPFFAGRAILNQRVNIKAPRPGERVFFELPRLDCIVAKVRLNGYACADIVWQPYRAELTDHVQEGENLLEVELVSSLRNLLGPHHNNRGELVAVGPGDFGGHGGWSQAGDDAWLKLRKEGKARVWTDDYFLVPFGLSNPAIKTYAASP